MIELTVRARHHAFRKQHQRPFRLRQNLHSALQRIPVHPLPIHAENPGPPQQVRLQPGLHKKVSTRHYVERSTRGRPEMRQHHGVTRPAVVRRQHDSVPGLDRRLKPVSPLNLYRRNPVRPLQVSVQKQLQHLRPHISMARRNKLIRLIDHNILHTHLASNSSVSLYRR